MEMRASHDRPLGEVMGILYYLYLAKTKRAILHNVSALYIAKMDIGRLENIHDFVVLGPECYVLSQYSTRVTLI